MAESDQNSGFVIPQSESNTQQNQQAQPMMAQPLDQNMPVASESNSSMPVFIGVGVLILLAVVFIFIKNSYTNSLVQKRTSPRKASIAGWWLYLFLLFLSAAVAVIVISQSVMFAGILFVAAIIFAVMTFISSRD